MGGDKARQCSPIERVLSSILLFVTFFSILHDAEGEDSILEKIARSVPSREEGWITAGASQPYGSSDGAKHAGFRWTRKSEELSATITIYRNTRAAREGFQGTSGKDGSHIRGFMIKGVGDEAYLFPPIIRDQDGPFNLTFRSGRYVVWMTARSRDTVTRCANYLVDAIVPSDRRP